MATKKGTLTSTPEPKPKPKPKPKRHAITVDDLWALDRIGEPSLSPDGRLVAVAVTAPSMKHNKSASGLWLLSTQGDAPRRLTHAGDKDAHPCFSPRGDLIAFTAKREQEGSKDEESQIYVIAHDGGEARRVGRHRHRRRGPALAA